MASLCMHSAFLDVYVSVCFINAKHCATFQRFCDGFVQRAIATIASSSSLALPHAECVLDAGSPHAGSFTTNLSARCPGAVRQSPCNATGDTPWSNEQRQTLHSASGARGTNAAGTSTAVAGAESPLQRSVDGPQGPDACHDIHQTTGIPAQRIQPGLCVAATHAGGWRR